MLCCAARTPRMPHAALALLPLVRRTRTSQPARAPALDLAVAASSSLAHGRPCPPLGGLAHGPANRGHRAPAPPARGACTRAGQPRTQVRPRGGKQPTNDTSTPPRAEKMLRARMGATPEMLAQDRRRYAATTVPCVLSRAEPSFPTYRPIRSTAPPPSTGLVSHPFLPAALLFVVLRVVVSL